MNINIIDALVSVVLVWILIPKVGLAGYVITIYVTEILNTTLSISRMLPISGMRVHLWRQIFGPLACVVGACCGMRVCMAVLHIGMATSAPALVLQITGTALLYIGLLVATNVIDKRAFRTVRSLLPI